jgi:hypothetical protein
VDEWGEAGIPCDTWFGVACDNGAGSADKVLPGIKGTAGCSGVPWVHFNGVMGVCGNDFEPTIFVRAE